MSPLLSASNVSKTARMAASSPPPPPSPSVGSPGSAWPPPPPAAVPPSALPPSAPPLSSLPAPAVDVPASVSSAVTSAAAVGAEGVVAAAVLARGGSFACFLRLISSIASLVRSSLSSRAALAKATRCALSFLAASHASNSLWQAASLASASSALAVNAAAVWTRSSFSSMSFCIWATRVSSASRAAARPCIFFSATRSSFRSSVLRARGYTACRDHRIRAITAPYRKRTGR